MGWRGAFRGELKVMIGGKGTGHMCEGTYMHYRVPVPLNRKNSGSGSGIQHPEHYFQDRQVCLNSFVKELGHMPLVHSQEGISTKCFTAFAQRGKIFASISERSFSLSPFFLRYFSLSFLLLFAFLFGSLLRK